MADVEITPIQDYPMPPRPEVETEGEEEESTNEIATQPETSNFHFEGVPAAKKRGRPKGSKLCPVCRKMIRPGVEHVCSGNANVHSSDSSGGTSPVAPVPIDPNLVQSEGLVRGIFSICEARFGPVWQVTDGEVKSIADPLAKLVPITNDPTTALIIACVLVIGPRAYITYEVEKKKASLNLNELQPS
jgi:hypothetical protein